MASRLKIKVCGMRDDVNILQIGSLLPDYMGFIFYQSSPRFVGDDFQIPKDFPNSIKRVGVFVNETADSVIDKVKQHQLDYVQLHGDESVEYCTALSHEGISIIKVFRVDNAFDFSVTDSFADRADFFLFDTKGPKFGGNAQTFDWKLLVKYNQVRPFFLSGGLDLKNLESIEEFNVMNLYAIDVNSGVELSPGIKDAKKVSAILKKLQV